MASTRVLLNPNDLFSLGNDGIAILHFLVRFAGEAPSSHNTQPWLFAFSKNEILVYGNKIRKLAASDTNNRQFFLSIGCAIQNILTAADYYGFPFSVEYFPDKSDPFFAARIIFKSLELNHKEHDANHLIFEITKRHANRELFSGQPIPEDFLSRVRGMGDQSLAITPTSDDATKKAIAAVVVDATVAAMNDRDFSRELSEWMKPSFPKYRDGMPGYNIGIPWLLSFIFPLVLRYGSVANQQRKMIGKMLEHTPTFLTISTAEDNPREWLRAGQTLERIWLNASREGIKVGILAAAVQIGEFYNGLKDALGTSFRPQVFCRIGYANKIPPKSPRLLFNEIVK